MSKQDTPPRETEQTIPKGVLIASAWSWRLLVIFAAIGVIIYVAAQLKVILIPFIIAILLAALLVPIVNRLRTRGWPKGVAIATSLIGTLLTVGALVFLVLTQIRSAWPDLQVRGGQALVAFNDFLTSPVIGFSQQGIDNTVQDLIQFMQANSQLLTTGLSSAGGTAGHVLAGIFLALFALLFILIDGKNIWRWFVGLFPRRARAAIDGSGGVSWVVLRSFVKSQVLVAGVDALGIGIGALILGVPLAVPIAVLVFFGSFIPVVGAILTGTLAVVVALVFNGWVSAAIMLGVVILVQQLESHVLQPFLIGKAIKIHPLAVVFSVAIGTLIAGIPGALFAVPFVAVLSKSIDYINHRAWEK